MVFSFGVIELTAAHGLEFSKLALTDSELNWLQATCSYFKPEYLEYLRGYRFKPDQVKVTFCPLTDDPNEDKGHVEIETTGPWVETIMWDVPLMACLSELYFRMVDYDWDYVGQTGEHLLQFSSGLIVICLAQKLHTPKGRHYLKPAALSANSVPEGEDRIIFRI